MRARDVERGGRWNRLRRYWSGNNRIRLMLTLQLAVMLPAAALVYANYAHLKSIERDKVLEASIHRDFQQMLAISEKKINLRAYTMAEEIRSAFPCPDTTSGVDVAAELDRLLATHPSLAHVFLYDARKGLVLRSQPHQMSDSYFFEEHQQIAKMLGGWLSFEAKPILESIQKKPKPIAWSTETVKRADGNAYMTTAFFSLPDLPNDRIVLAGASFDSEYLKRTFFPKILDDLIAYKFGEEGGNPLAMSVSPADSEAGGGLARGRHEVLAASAGWAEGEAEVCQNFDDVFRGLALGIKFQGTSIEAIGRNWVRRAFLTLGVLSLLLVGGLVLTYRSFSKEVELARLKSDFVSNVSHELRTPLALIRLYAETLEMGRITTRDKAEEYYRTIRKESERLTSLINNILDFSRIEAGRKEYDFRRTDLAELVSNTLDTYRDQIDEQGFTFEQNIAPDIPPVVVDREAIARSLVNLVNNALKYSADDKFIGVKLYRSNGALKLEVTDHGIGIARGEQAKIFDKFYRAGDPLVHNTKGSGLGLSLVRHIAHAHGGEVKVESTPGKGSTFTLSLPLEGTAARPSVSQQEV